MNNLLLITLLSFLSFQGFAQERKSFGNKIYVKKESVWYDVNSFKVDSTTISVHLSLFGICNSEDYTVLLRVNQSILTNVL